MTWRPVPISKRKDCACGTGITHSDVWRRDKVHIVYLHNNTDSSLPKEK
ncbi:MAG: hypothetical protein AB7F74_18155 [Parvibaculaceae bacterium]